MSVCDLLEGVWLGVGSPGHKPDCLLAPRVPSPPPVLAVTRFLQANVPTLVGLPFTKTSKTGLQRPGILALGKIGGGYGSLVGVVGEVGVVVS